MERLHLFHRNADGGLNGQGTVLVLEQNENDLYIVSCRDLNPNLFREIVLRNSQDQNYIYDFVSTIHVDGVSLPVSVEPFVFHIRLRGPL